MTTKTVSTYIAAGYSLASQYDTLEASILLLTVGLVAARAVNILS
ncbi:MAG: hypothetical protein ABI056_04085 [Caulobacteraceae bacterium]